MNRTLITLGCALALAGGSALAQQGSTTGSQAGNNGQGASVTEKVKDAAKTVGQKTKEAAVKVKDTAVQVGKDVRSKAKEVKTATVGAGKEKE